METKHNRPLNEVDYTNFTVELISLPNQDSKLDYLNFISSYYETNKSLYKQIIEKIQNLITDLTNDFMQSPQFKNSKLEWFELIEQYEKYYRNPNRGQFTVRDLEGLRDLVYQFKVEQPAAPESPKIEEVEEKKVKIHQRTLDKNIRDLDMTNYYVQQRENKNIKDSKVATKRNFKSKENKLISDKTFIRAMKSNKEILKKKIKKVSYWKLFKCGLSEFFFKKSAK